MASIFKVVAICSRWYLFQVVVWLGAHLRLAGWLGGRLAALMFSGRRTADGGRRSAVGGQLTGGGPILFGNLSHFRTSDLAKEF